MKTGKIVLSLLAVNVALDAVIMAKGNDIETDDADYLLVLGSALKNNVASETLKMRLVKASEYLNKNVNTLAILCGGITKGNTISEAKVMRDYLIQEGIDSNRLILEDKSQTTIENILNSKGFINEDSKIVVLTSRFHVYRAKQICKANDLIVKGVGAKSPIKNLFKDLLVEKVCLVILHVRRDNL